MELCYSINHKGACNHFRVFTITSNQDLPLIQKKTIHGVIPNVL